MVQCLYNGLADTNPYAVFVSISMTSPFIFLLVPTSLYTVAGSACELGLCDSLDLLEMQQRTEATNTPREKDTIKVTETDIPTVVPHVSAVHVSAAIIDGPEGLGTLVDLKGWVH